VPLLAVTIVLLGVLLLALPLAAGSQTYTQATSATRPDVMLGYFS